MSFLNELKRRNVLRVGAAYVVSSWLLIQVAETIFPLFGYGDTPARLVVIVLAIAFIPSLIFAWVFEITPEGLKKDADVVHEESLARVTGKKLDRVILVVLALALTYFAFDKFVLDPVRDAELVEETAQQTRTDVLVESYGDLSIAVLPFVNMSDDATNEYFSDGISEELLNLLAKIPELRVISRSSAFSFKGKDFDIPTVATKLNVAYVLEGSVRKAGNQIRITTQLIEARSDSQLWSETYDRTLEDIFTIQDEIALSVVRQLRVMLLGEAAPKAATTDPEAYALFLQSRHVANRYTKEAQEQAELLLKEALAIDSGFAPAWNSLGDIYMSQEVFGRPVEESKELAYEAYQQALTIDPDYAPTYAGLSQLARVNFDFAEADQYLQRALKLGTGIASPLATAASLMRTLGRFEMSIDLAQKSISLDPVWPAAYANLGYSCYYALRYDEAATAFRKSLSLNPERSRSHYYLGRVLLAQGEMQAALAEMEKEPVPVYQVTGMAMVYHAIENKEASRQALAKLIDNWGEAGAFQIAEVYAFLGENDAAFKWLQKAYDTHDFGLAVLLGNPVFAKLTSDARYASFVEKLGLMPYLQEMNQKQLGY